MLAFDWEVELGFVVCVAIFERASVRKLVSPAEVALVITVLPIFIRFLSPPRLEDDTRLFGFIVFCC